eukprot:CAMPEP_0194279264 /NCGR_PEP_ID=MMETSP0169-20130528/13831_1 /TAXON_ID=218684 /ORGANISM="Corethron pennatum, Strain L29A3" /LENGTH=463 /DNA_ID=CAMNT_0039023665 /DNA_START=213 /DNA_END=1604 /DNA_ORIENTATION=+
MLKSIVVAALILRTAAHPSASKDTFTIIDSSTSVTADSGLGQKVLSRARRVEDNSYSSYGSSSSYYDMNIDYSYIAGYSLKFLGCHTVSMWNGNDQDQNDERRLHRKDEKDMERKLQKEDKNDEKRKLQDYSDQVFISSKPLVRFRLCPSETCNDNSATGCKNGYGDYVIDLNQYLEAYLENKIEVQEKLCDDVANYDKCGCQNGNADDMDACEYNCYMSFGYDFCLTDGENEQNQQNGYYGGNDQYSGASTDIADYTQCVSFDFLSVNQNINRYSSSYNAAMWYDSYGQEMLYYVGPTCTSQGGDVRLSVFTDDSCTVRSTHSFNTLSGGWQIPYTDKSLIGDECVKCKYEGYEYNNGNGNGYYDNGEYQQDSINEFCGTVYSISGKCETNMHVFYPNINGCSYISGLQLAKEDGIIRTSATRSSKVAGFFIGMLMTCSSVLGFYVYYLQSKMTGPKLNLDL